MGLRIHRPCPGPACSLPPPRDPWADPFYPLGFPGKQEPGGALRAPWCWERNQSQVGREAAASFLCLLPSPSPPQASTPQTSAVGDLSMQPCAPPSLPCLAVLRREASQYPLADWPRWRPASKVVQRYRDPLGTLRPGAECPVTERQAGPRCRGSAGTRAQLEA